MKTNNCLYAFVITNAYFDNCNRLTLDVSNKPIDNLSKTVKNGVKTGVFYARFDIDASNNNTYTQTECYNNLFGICKSFGLPDSVCTWYYNTNKFTC